MKATSLDRGRDRRDDPPLAMTDQADFSGVDFLLLLEKVQSRQHVAREVFICRRVGGTGRPADSSVIDSKHGYPTPAKMIGQHEKRLVPHDAFIAILRSRAGDEDDSRERARSGRHGQRARQRNSARFILVLDVLSAVRERRLWCLWPRGLGDLVRLGERERKLGTALAKLTLERITFLIFLTREFGPDDLAFPGELVVFEADRADGDVMGALVRASECCPQFAVFAFFHFQCQPELDTSADVQLSLPDARELRGNRHRADLGWIHSLEIEHERFAPLGPFADKPFPIFIELALVVRARVLCGEGKHAIGEGEGRKRQHFRSLVRAAPRAR